MSNPIHRLVTLTILCALSASAIHAQDAPAYRYTGEPSSTYLRAWLLCGPFPAGAELGPDEHLADFDTDFLKAAGGEANAAPQPGATVTHGGETLNWELHQSPGGAIDLDEAVSKAERIAAYAYAEIQSAQEQAVILALGSNDGVRVWLNGEVVWDYPAGRSLTLDSDLVPVVLRPGVNRLLLKIEERGNLWEFSARFLPPAPGTLNKVTLFDVQTPPSGPPELVFKFAPSLFGTLIREALFVAHPVNDPADIAWQQSLSPNTRWTIHVDYATYRPHLLQGIITFANGARREVELPFAAGRPITHTLFENGRTDYTIVLDANASESERWAATELQHWLREVSQAEFPVTGTPPSPNAPAIHVGLGDAARTLLGGDATTFDTEDETFVYQNAGPSIVIAGGAERGTMYGVMSFLERELGIRWYTPSVTVTPARDRYTFEYLHHTESPGIRVRNDFYHEAFEPIWAARNRVNGAMTLRDQPGGLEGYWSVHTFYPLIPPDEFFADHPEYFSLIDGERTTERAQLCLTHPSVLDILTDRLREVMRAQPDYLIYSVSQNDWYGACQCSDCQAIAEREGSEAGVMIWFVNQVAERVEDEFPDKFIGTLAYQYTRHPPRHIRPRHNVVVRLCSIECCFAHDFASCPKNVDFLADLEGWAAISPHLYIWDYVVNFSHYVMPYPNFRVLQPNIQMFRDNAAIGIMEQGAYQSRGGEFAELRAYILSKLLWDPEAGVQRVIDDFMYGYYGRSGQYIRAYFDLLHEQITPDTHIHLGLQPNDIIFSGDFIRDARALFDQAETVADTTEILHRVELARLPLLYLQCRRDPATSILDGSYDRLKRIAERERVTHFAESGAPHREAFHRLMESAAQSLEAR